MTQKHKNAEYIIAFANGEEVEWHYSSVDFAYDPWQEAFFVGTCCYVGEIS